jgi:hypothetical protein
VESGNTGTKPGDDEMKGRDDVPYSSWPGMSRPSGESRTVPVETDHRDEAR